MVGILGMLIFSTIGSINAHLLGQRIRQMRIRRNLTQQDLAGEDYTKSFISAIEQGKARPSLEALQRLASRLQAPPGVLLDPNPATLEEPDDSLPKRVHRRRGLKAEEGQPVNSPTRIEFQLNRARYLLYTGNPPEALAVVQPLLGAAGPGIPALDITYQQQALLLAGKAALAESNTGEAIDHLDRALAVAERMHDPNITEKTRNMLGLAYFRAGQPPIALDHHRRGADAVEANAVSDPNLQVQIYSNLADDYRALQSIERAQEAYKTALEVARRTSNLAGQASVFWNQAEEAAGSLQTYQNAGLQAARAVGIYEALDNIKRVGEVQAHYAATLLEQGDLQAAEHHLQGSLELTSHYGRSEDNVYALAALARLSLQRGDAHAESRAQAAVSAARDALAQEEESRGQGQGQNVATAGRRELTEALSTALVVQAELAAARDNSAQATQLFIEAIALAEQIPTSVRLGDIYQRYAHVLAQAGEHERASAYYERAFTARQASRVRG